MAKAKPNLFFRIDKVKGDSLHVKHKDWIEIVGYSLAISSSSWLPKKERRSDPAGAQFGDLVLDKKPDQASTALIMTLIIPPKATETIKATLDVVDANNVSICTYCFEDVVISSYVTTTQEIGGPLETLQISYGRIGWNYTDLAGTAHINGYDREARAAWAPPRSDIVI